MHRYVLLCLWLSACTAGAEPEVVAPPPPQPTAKRVEAPPARPTPASVVGTEVDPFEGARWLRGETDADGLQLVVLWELWCPHCKRELPKLEAVSEAWKERGLTVSALTRLTRNVSEADALSFAEEQGTTFPIGVTTDAIPRALGARGVPAAALVHDGVVVWSGHPAQLGGSTLDELVASTK